MSEKKNPEKIPSMDENYNPKREGPENTEEQQVEKSIPSIDIENADLPDSLEALNLKNPTFDIALGQLALQIKENQTSSPKSTDAQIAALESTSDQMAELERTVELVLASESDAKADLESARDGKADSESDSKADLENAGVVKAASGSAGDATDQMIASESPVQSSASWDPAKLELPQPPRMNRIYNLVRKHFPPLFTEGNRMRDVYGVTTIRDEILLDSHHKLLYLLYTHRLQHKDAGLETLLSEFLIREVKYFYSLGLIKNVVLEGDSSNFSQLFPTPGEEGKLICAAVILGFTLLAFAEYTLTERERRLKQIAVRCRTAGVPLPSDSQTQPLHPWARWLQCVSVSYTELKQYSEALKDAINYFTTRNIESITRELDCLAIK